MSLRLALSFAVCVLSGALWGRALTHITPPEVPLVLLGLALLVGLFIWSMYPMREMAERVSRMTPENLNERLRPPWRWGAASRLAHEIDGLLDRVAGGYDAQRQFAATASHELRTPLAVQRTLIEISLRKMRTPEQLHLLSEQLLETNSRNEQTIEGLLVLAETDRGLGAPTAERLDVLARTAVDTLTPRARDAGLTLSLTGDVLTVLGERVLLERMITNLVENAIKYNYPGGTVSVVIGGRHCLTVSNTGPVVNTTEAATLFEPFRRLGGVRLHHDTGAGLGLTIVRSIVKAHAGTVTAAPRESGGLDVTVDLPWIPTAAR